MHNQTRNIYCRTTVYTTCTLYVSAPRFFSAGLVVGPHHNLTCNMHVLTPSTSIAHRFPLQLSEGEAFPLSGTGVAGTQCVL